MILPFAALAVMTELFQSGVYCLYQLDAMILSSADQHGRLNMQNKSAVKFFLSDTLYRILIQEWSTY
jgi:hypothetical protein